MVWALRAPCSGTDKVVLIGLANHADPAGENAWPSLSTLSEYAQVDRRNVRRSIDRLIAAGLVEKQVKAGGDQRVPVDKRPNRYKLSLNRGGVRALSPSTEGALVSERGGAGIPREGALAPPKPSLNRPEPRRSTREGFMFLAGTGWIPSEERKNA